MALPLRLHLRDLDDIVLHGAEQPQKLICLPCGHIEHIERRHEVLNKRPEIGCADLHSGMCAFHVAALIHTGPTRGIAHLGNQMTFQIGNISRRKAPIDPAISRDIGHKLIDHRRDARSPAQAIVQRPRRRRSQPLGAPARSRFQFPHNP